MKTKFKRIIKDIIALIIAVFLFGTVFIITYSGVNKQTINFEWKIYFNTAVIIFIIFIIDIFTTKYKK